MSGERADYLSGFTTGVGSGVSLDLQHRVAYVQADCGRQDCSDTCVDDIARHGYSPACFIQNKAWDMLIRSAASLNRSRAIHESDGEDFMECQ